MSYVFTNGIRLAYQRSGRGKSVLLIMGSFAAGRVWTLHQTPALVQAGYEAITFDNRGVPLSDVPPGRYSVADMVADTRGLIEELGLAPCRVVGTSLGAMIAQELAIASPDMVRCAVLIATRARADAFRRARTLADCELVESGIRLPARHEAAISVLQMLSPRTLNDDSAVTGWLDLFESTVGDNTAVGQAWADIVDDRRTEYGQISVPCRVIAFADDVIAPPHLGFEVAEAIPDCDFIEIPECGHLGYLERPRELNSAIIEFLDKS